MPTPMLGRSKNVLLILLNVMAIVVICCLSGVAAMACNSHRHKENKGRTRAVHASLAEVSPPDWTLRAVIVDSLYQTMKDVHDVLTYTGVGYAIDSGTLLGAVRNKGLIPNDDDLDIRVSSEDRALLVETAFRRLHKLGYETCECFFGYKVFPENGKVFHDADLKYKFPALDIFMTTMDGGRTETQHDKWPSCYFTDTEFFLTKMYGFGPLRLFGPASTKDYFDRCYGTDWNEFTYTTYDHSTETYLGEGSKVALTEEGRRPSLPSKPLRQSKYSNRLQTE